MAERVGSVLDGKYEITRLLGEGGMGAVYEAHHRLIGRRLAIKFLHAQLAASAGVVARFQREAKAAARIGHENIIEVTDMGQAPDGAPYIVMEYLEGRDLRQVLDEAGGALPIARSCHILVQALAALEAAHRADIIHRDLKPENIFLLQRGPLCDYVKLLDFGISKFRALESDGAKQLTQTGTVLGTPSYMSPEQARGEQDLSAASDIYAMGVILYQSLTGRLPFDAPNYNALLVKILSEDPPAPESLRPDLPADLVETIKTAMARAPASRFPDCQSFRERLLPYAREDTAGVAPTRPTRDQGTMVTPETGTPLGMTVSAAPPGRERVGLRTRVVLGGSAIGVVLAGVLGFALFRGVEPVPTSPVSSDAASPPVTSAPVEATSVALRITALPAAATIAVDGQGLNSNPFHGRFPRDGRSHRIEISLEGHGTVAADVKFDRDQELSYELAPMKAPDGAPRPVERPVQVKAGAKRGGATPVEDVDKSRKPNRPINDQDPWTN